MRADNLTVGKSKKLALRVMKLVQYLTQHKSPYFIIDQIGRSGTSIGANVIEAEYAISKKEFLMKMYISRIKSAMRRCIGWICCRKPDIFLRKVTSPFLRTCGSWNASWPRSQRRRLRA